MTGKFKIGKSSKEEYKKFLKKADEFFEIMQQSLKKEKWNAAGLNAIHTGISLAVDGIPFSISSSSASNFLAL
jgi:hypothetical protein